MIVMAIGGMLLAFGLVDLIGSFAGIDVWTDWLAVELPEVVWSFTAIIEIGLGWFLLKLGHAMRSAKAETAPERAEP